MFLWLAGERLLLKDLDSLASSSTMAGKGTEGREQQSWMLPGVGMLKHSLLGQEFVNMADSVGKHL